MRQVFINDFEKVSSLDINDLQLALHQSIFDDGIYNFFGRTDGFLGNGFKASFVSALAGSLAIGVGFKYDSSQVGYQPKYRMILAEAAIPVTFAAANTQNRIDKICVQENFLVSATAQRFVKTGGVGPIVLTTVDKDKKDSVTVQIVTGTPAGSPVAPATPAGFIAIATAYIHANTGMSSQSDITDLRSILTLAVDGSGHNIATGSTVQQQLDQLDAYLTNTGVNQEELTYVSLGLYSIVHTPTAKANIAVGINGGFFVDPSEYDLVNYGGGKAIQFHSGHEPDQSAGDVVEALIFNSGVGGGPPENGYVVTRGAPAAGYVTTAAGGISGITTDTLQQQYVKSNSGHVTVTATPQVAAGTSIGQKLILIGTDDTNYITLANGNGLELSASIDLKNHSRIQLDWQGSVWSEDFRRA